MGTIIVSWHGLVSAQLYVTTFLLVHSRISTIMYGHNRVWSQWCMGTIIVCVHNRTVCEQDHVSTIIVYGP